MSDEPLDVVLYEERDDIAIITLNRPHKKNTLTDAMIQGVADGIDAATKSRDVAAIVLRGSDERKTHIWAFMRWAFELPSTDVCASGPRRRLRRQRGGG